MSSEQYSLFFQKHAKNSENKYWYDVLENVNKS